MGRRAYMNLLTLGRSPYEPPEETAEDQRHTQSDVHADGYTQEYDARGHPINPDSKSLAKQLRRAKNDILSTMGIVVSGEDGTLSSRKDRQKSKIVSDENDYGLAMATLDQVVMFVCPWWASSLGARVQVFGAHTRASLMEIMRIERSIMGRFGFYYSGMPVWIGSFFVSVCRNHLLGSTLELIHRNVASLFKSKRYKTVVDGIFRIVNMSTNGVLIFMSGQAYNFSLLQSLHILPPSIPKLSSLIPFGAFSITQLPPFPVDASFPSIVKFGFQFLTSPAILIYFYIHLRPLIEGRIYRLLRRRLPKPDRPDKVSVHVAVENDLIEWTVPTMGRRAEEENLRSRLTLVEDFVYELILLKNWARDLFQWKREDRPEEDPDDDGLHVHENRVEHLRQIQQEQALRQGVTEEESQPQQYQERRRRRPPERTHQMPPGGSATDLTGTQSNEAFLDEGQQIMQSPQQLPEEYFTPTTHSTGVLETAPGPVIPTSHRSFTEHIDGDRRLPISRTNTLFSRPSSLESSPLPSPLVRASLVHQNSDIITMQLELLQSNNSTNTGPQNSNENTYNDAPPPHQAHQVDPSSDAVDSAAGQMLDTLLSYDQELTNGNVELPALNDSADTIVPTTTASAPEPLLAEESGGATNAVGRDSISRSPHSMSPEPSQQPPERSITTESQSRMLPIPSRPHLRSLVGRTYHDHRVTILSAHPVDSLASHLAALVTAVLFYPFESFFLRHLASTFLSSPAVLSGTIPLGMAASTIGLRPIGAWFGGGGRSDMLGYASKMVVVTGVQAMISAGIWGAGTAITVMLGTKKFGWGDL